MKVPITDLVIDADIQIREKLDPDLIEHYTECFDALPPIDVFRVAPGYLVGDGFHRCAAAKRLGLKEMEATLHDGGWDEAKAWAITSNAKHGKPLTRTERNEGVKRLLGLPGWTERRIADAIGVHQTTVMNIHHAVALRPKLPAKVSDHLEDATLYRIATVEPDLQVPLATVAAEANWTEPEVRLATKTLNDPAVAPQIKEAILSGRLDPIGKSNGQVVILEDTIQRKTEEINRKDATLAVAQFNIAAAHLAGFTAEEIAKGLDPVIWEATVVQFEMAVHMLNGLIERLSPKVVSA
ncbi:MAG: ParB/RepB/Spo0J family partition protein [Candidatus Limnocylindrales bacterium]